MKNVNKQNRSKLLHFILLFLLVNINSLSANELPKLPLATGEWPPYTSVNLPDKGFFSEFIDAVVTKMGMQAELTFYPWKRAQEELLGGKVFGAFPYAVTAERMKDFDFSDSITFTTTVFFYSKKDYPNGIPFEKLADLQSYKIGVVSGFKSAADLTQAGLNIEEVTKDEQNINKLILNRIQLTPINQLVGWEVIRQTVPGAMDSIGTLKKPLHRVETSLMISRKYPEYEQLKTQFNAALKEVQSQGLYAKLLIKHGLRE